LSISRPDGKKLDALWSLVVKEKAGYKCEHCKRYDSRMEAAHVVGRRHRATRWGTNSANISPLGEDEAIRGSSQNVPNYFYDLCGHCLCHVCHQEYDEHGSLEPEIINQTIGRERLTLIQFYSKKKIAKYQIYDDVLAILESEREANDDSPYSKKKA